LAEYGINIDENEPPETLPIIAFINTKKTIPCVLPVPVSDGAPSIALSEIPWLKMSGISTKRVIAATMQDNNIPIPVAI
jgi:hypothetical protein